MENTSDSSFWNSIKHEFPEAHELDQRTGGIDLSKVAAQYERLLDGRETLSDFEKVYIINELAFDSDINGLPKDGEILHIEGQGMYYTEKTDTLEFIDGTAGISGYFAGLTIDDLPHYHDLVYINKNKAVYQPKLCIMLSWYAQHNSDNTPGIFMDDLVVVPITGQPLMVQPYDNDLAA